jgi:uncharacterized membrane protein
MNNYLKKWDNEDKILSVLFIIIGFIIMIITSLALFFSFYFLYLFFLIALMMIIFALTGFCPIYILLKLVFKKNKQ